MTKDPETKEFMMVTNLRSRLLSNFSNILWYYKIHLLWGVLIDYENCMNQDILKDFNSGNIFQI